MILQLQFLQSVKMPNQHQFYLYLSLDLMFVGLFVFLYLCVSAFLKFCPSLFFCHSGRHHWFAITQDQHRHQHQNGSISLTSLFWVVGIFKNQSHIIQVSTTHQAVTEKANHVRVWGHIKTCTSSFFTKKEKLCESVCLIQPLTSSPITPIGMN